MGGPHAPRAESPADADLGPRRFEQSRRRLDRKITDPDRTAQVERLKAVVASIDRRFSAATVRPAADLLFIADRAPLPARELAPSRIWASTLTINEPVKRET
jgi:hypothetical protein